MIPPNQGHICTQFDSAWQVNTLKNNFATNNIKTIIEYVFPRTKKTPNHPFSAFRRESGSQCACAKCLQLIWSSMKTRLSPFQPPAGYQMARTIVVCSTPAEQVTSSSDSDWNRRESHPHGRSNYCRRPWTLTMLDEVQTAQILVRTLSIISRFLDIGGWN